MAADHSILFVCPSCGESVEVDGSMRRSLLRNGCVLCGARVRDDAFSNPRGGHR